ncbi:hypothetical protein ACFFU9_13360 [Mariniflexile ostreae]|uniref:Uncharacterized protein n=1 Tax=Mariniflexile ostreae TaxID=1520892 RepID=A0ABV5FE57_9FLAO
MKTIKLSYIVLVTILLLLVLEDVYQVFVNASNYPFGKEDLGVFYKSKSHYIIESVVLAFWFILAYFLNALKKIVCF